MVTKKAAVEQVLTGLGTGKLTIDEAVAKADALKPLNNKNKTRAWKDQFAAYGTITKDETGTYVTARAVATPTPVAVPEVAKTE